MICGAVPDSKDPTATLPGKRRSAGQIGLDHLARGEVGADQFEQPLGAALAPMGKTPSA